MSEVESLYFFAGGMCVVGVLALVMALVVRKNGSADKRWGAAALGTGLLSMGLLVWGSAARIDRYIAALEHRIRYEQPAQNIEKK